MISRVHRLLKRWYCLKGSHATTILPETHEQGETPAPLRSVASIALGLWFLAVKTCLTLALEAVHAVLVGRRDGCHKLRLPSPSSQRRGTDRDHSISNSSRRRVRIRRWSGESSAASRTGSEGEEESNDSGVVVSNTVYHSKTIKLRYRSSLKKRKEQVRLEIL